MIKMETRKIASNQKNPLLNEWYNERMTVAIYPSGPETCEIESGWDHDSDYIMKIGQFNNEISSNEQTQKKPTLDPFLSRIFSLPVAPVWSRRRKEALVRKRNIPPLYSGISRNINLFYPRAHKDVPVSQTLVCKVFLAADDKRKLNIRLFWNYSRPKRVPFSAQFAKIAPPISR